jgi:hypothetical protein
LFKARLEPLKIQVVFAQQEVGLLFAFTNMPRSEAFWRALKREPE